MIDLRNAGIDSGVGVARKLHLAFENLCDELLDHIAATFARDLFFSKPSLLNDLIQQARFRRLSFRRIARPPSPAYSSEPPLGLSFSSSFFNLISFLRIANGFHQKIVQLVVALQSAAQISKLLAEFK